MKIAKGLLWGLFVVLFFVGLGTIVAIRATQQDGGGRSIEDIEKNRGMAIEVQKPHRMDFTEYIYCDGEIAARERYVLRANISEQVEAVHVDVGDVVREGQLLVEFRKTDLKAEIDAARAAAEEAKANYHRYQALQQKGVVSEDVVEARRTAYQNTLAALRRTESKLAFAEVRTPTGTAATEGKGNLRVSRRMVDPGEFKAVGKELLTLINLSQLEVRARVPETAVRYAAVDTELGFRLENETAWRDGEVVRTSPSTGDPNRFFDVFLLTDNQRQSGAWALRPGMYTEVRVPRQSIRNALAVPSTAIRREAGLNFLFVVRRHTEEVPANNPGNGQSKGFLQRLISRLPWTEENEEGPRKTREEDVLRAHRLPVQPGLHSKRYVQLTGDPVDTETKVVVSPRYDLRDGTKVTIANGAGASADEAHVAREQEDK